MGTEGTEGTSSLKEFLLKLNKNYLLLKEREAKYATAAPLDLLNQIDDYEQALELAQQAIDQNLPLDVLQVEFSGLNLQIDTVVFISQEPPRKPFTGRNPFRGLRKFTEDEAEFFFGRSAAIQSLLDTIKRLLDPQTSHELPDLVTVLGPSGSGKSSLVRAGVIPALRQGRLPGSEHWIIKTMVPGPHPLDELAAQFVEPTGRGLPAVRADLNTGEKALHQLLLESLTRAGKPEDAVFVLVIDQFEELFTLCEDEAERQAFLAQLLYVAEARRNRGLIILTMRADFYGKAAAYKQLAEVIILNQMLVSPMTEKELREAILLPAEAVGLELEKALVETLLNDTAKAPGVLPLLQHTLQELFNQRDGNLLTLEAYRAMGGVKGALAHRADAILDSMPLPQRHIVRRIFMRLIQSEEGAAITRRRATFNEVLTEDSQVSEIEAVIQVLTSANLIVTSHNQETGEILLDVTHEALLVEWPRFQSWLDWDRQGLRIRQQLSLAARDWESRGRDQDSLYRGARLLEVEEWVAANPGEINPLEQAFIKASLAARAWDEAQKRKRTQRLIAILTGSLILVALGAIYGFYGQYKALNSEATAVADRSLAVTAEANAEVGRIAAVAAEAKADVEREIAVTAEAKAVRESRISLAQSLAALALPILERTHHTELAALLAAEAEHLNRGVQGDAQALIDSSLRRILGNPYFNVALSGHEEEVRAVAFSPNGRTLASASDDKTIRLWNLNSAAEPKILKGHEDRVTAVAFSPKEQILASASDDTTVRLWNLADPDAESVILPGHESSVFSVAFSPDGQTLASAGNDPTIRLWQVADSTAEPIVLTGHQATIRSVAFSPDGQTLASASDDMTIRLWDLADPDAEPVVLSGHEASVLSVAFSPDGQTLASASASPDQTIRLWQVADPTAQPIILSGHASSILSVAFSPDGQILASASARPDQTIRLWQVADPTAQPTILTGHENNVWSVSFSPNGETLASASADRTIKLWNLAKPAAAPVPLRDHRGSVESVAFSPDGQTLASASDDTTIRLWNMANLTIAPEILEGHLEIVRSVAFSPDGQTLASGSEDQTIRLWNVTDPTAEPIVLTGHENKVVTVAFNRNGQTLASASLDQTIRLWQVTKSITEPIILNAKVGVSSVAFSPAPAGGSTVGIFSSAQLPNGTGGLILASAGFDPTIKFWDLVNPLAKPRILSSPQATVLAIAFSPNGQYLASAGDDGTIRLWNLTRPSDEPALLSGHEEGVWSVAFSPDGQTLASASLDQTIRLWQVASPSTDPTILIDHDDSVRSITFSPNGQILASGSDDRTVRLWIAQTDALAKLACQKVRRNLTAREWRQFLGGQQPYRRTCVNLPIHPSVIEAARDLAREGEIEEAVAQFQYLLTQDLLLDLDPAAEAQRVLSETIEELLDQGRELAENGQVELATAKFIKAVKLDPSRNLDPEAEALRLAQRTAINNLIGEGKELAKQGQLEEALAKFQEAEVLDATFKIAAEDWHALCVEGSQQEQTEAQAALPACDRAIELDPENSLFYSSRGLVRALIGDQAGALEDFKFVREQLQQNEEDRR